MPVSSRAPTRYQMASVSGFVAILAAVAAVLATTATLVNGLPATDTQPRRPPMGWSSWNYFGMRPTGPLLIEVADALTKTGLRASGYRYVNTDVRHFYRIRSFSAFHVCIRSFDTTTSASTSFTLVCIAHNRCRRRRAAISLYTALSFSR